MQKNENLKEKRDYAWNYFQLHASQRMSLFNFFVLISALLTAGLTATFKKECYFHALGFFLGSILMLISFVFWRIDKRVGFLIKHAEGVLKTLESHWTNENGNINEDTALFCSEERKTYKLRKDLQNKIPSQSWFWPISYSECFRFVYIAFGFIGLVGIIISIIRWSTL